MLTSVAKLLLSLGVPVPFHLNIPRLNLLSSPEVRQPGKAPNYSVNWTTSFATTVAAENGNLQPSNDDQLEIVDAMKGKEQVC